MKYIYVCNTSSDSVSKIDIDDFKLIKNINLSTSYNYRIGPQALCKYKDKLLIANNYSDDISIINTNTDEIAEKSFYVGKHCNDIKILNNYAYILCGDENGLNVLDIDEMEIVEHIPMDNFPRSIDIDYKNNRTLVANMRSDSIIIIEGENLEKIYKLSVGAYPTKAIFTEDGQHIIVCESNIGSYERGNISIFSAKDLRLINKISVGFSPVDMECEQGICYVSNFGEGTISVIDIYNYFEVNKIIVGGMPRAIKKINDYLYISDSYNNKLCRINLSTENKKAISIGGEPTGMAFV